MNNVDAKKLAERELEGYRKLSYQEIVSKIGEPEIFERIDDEGEPYRVEIEFFYHSADMNDIRVSAAVSYSFWTDLVAVSSDFIIAPDGTFVGE